MLGGPNVYASFKFVKPANFLENIPSNPVIGQGSFGFVLKAEDSWFRAVAVKFIYRKILIKRIGRLTRNLEMIPSEVFYLKNLNHRGIVQFLDYFEDGRYVYLVTELHGNQLESTK